MLLVTAVLDQDTGSQQMKMKKETWLNWTLDENSYPLRMGMRRALQPNRPSFS